MEGPRGGLGVGGWAGPPPLVTGRQVKGGVLSLAHREAIKGFTEGWTPCRGRLRGGKNEHRENKSKALLTQARYNRDMGQACGLGVEERRVNEQE